MLVSTKKTKFPNGSWIANFAPLLSLPLIKTASFCVSTMNTLFPSTSLTANCSKLLTELSCITNFLSAFIKPPLPIFKIHPFDSNDISLLNCTDNAPLGLNDAILKFSEVVFIPAFVVVLKNTPAVALFTAVITEFGPFFATYPTKFELPAPKISESNVIYAELLSPV